MILLTMAVAIVLLFAVLTVLYKRTMNLYKRVLDLERDNDNLVKDFVVLRDAWYEYQQDELKDRLFAVYMDMLETNREPHAAFQKSVGLLREFNRMYAKKSWNEKN